MINNGNDKLEDRDGIFSKLKKLFSDEVVVRRVGGKQVKIADVEHSQYGTSRNSLRDRFNRMHSTSYGLHSRDMAMAYQSARLETFRDYDVMDSDPLLNSALDIYADSCLTPNEFGKLITISSDDENIKQVLDNLFYDVLNVEFNMWSWVRNLCKYGDFYLLMDISPEYGVYSIHPLSPYEVTRVEGTDPDNKSYVKFQHDGARGGQEYENFEVAHFRLISDSNFLPYGRSMLEGARRVWKQLCLSGETIVWTKDGYKKIKDIVVGDEVYSFDYSSGKTVSTKVKNVAYTGNRKTYKIGTCHREISLTQEHPVMVRDGSYKKVQDLTINDYLILPTINSNEEIKYPKLTLSEELDSRTKVVDEQLIKDNFKEFIRFIGFMLGDGWLDKGNKSVAFSVGDRLDKSQKYIDLLTRLCVSYRLSNGIESDSSCVVTSSYLYKLLINLGFKTGSLNKEIPSWIWSLPNDIKAELLYGFSDADGCDRDENTFQLGGINEKLITELRELAMQCGLSVTRMWSTRGGSYQNSKPMFLFTWKYKSRDFIPEGNYHVERIREITEQKCEDVYDIEVENKLHNFLANGIVTHNCLLEDAMLIHRIVRAPEKRIFKIDVGNTDPTLIDGLMEKVISKMKKVPYIDERTGDYNLRYNLQSMMEDYFLPVRGSDSGTSIDTLGGMEFTGTEDIEYVRNKLMAALKMPKSFLGYGEDIGGKSTLNLLDIRFSMTINRLQKIICSELNKIALLHLYVQGYRDASLLNFKIELTNSSAVLEQEKIAFLQDKVNLAKDMVDAKLFSLDYIYKEVFKLSLAQIRDLKNGIVADRKILWRYTQIEEEGNDPATSKQSVDSEGGMKDAPDDGGDSGGGVDSGDVDDMGGLGSMGGDSGGGADAPDFPSEDGPLKEAKRVKTKDRIIPDQTGIKDASDYPFGENPLGKKEDEGSRTDPLRHEFKKGVLSIRESELRDINERINKKFGKKRSMLTEYIYTPIHRESKSMLDESQIIQEE